MIGADVRLVRSEFGIGVKASWEQAIKEIEAAGRKPYAIPAGASDHRLGGLGFAGWAAEVVAQERECGVRFDTIVVCSVTGSTQAGMIAGFAALRDAGPRRSSASTPRPSLPRPAPQSTGSPAPRPRSSAPTSRLASSWTSATTPVIYGIPDDATLAAMRLAARTEGMITDPVYEGKSMAGLIDLVCRGEIERGSNVLYAHLGGQPALSAYKRPRLTTPGPGSRPRESLSPARRARRSPPGARPAGRRTPSCGRRAARRRYSS